MAAVVEQIFIAPRSRATVVAVDSAELEIHKGIKGDRYHAAAEKKLAAGKNPPINQVTLIAAEELDDFLHRNDSDLDYGSFRRAIVTRGVDLNALVGRSFRIGSAICRGTELCEPCAWLKTNIHQQALPELVHRAGIRATVEQSGNVAPGALIEAVE